MQHTEGSFQTPIGASLTIADAKRKAESTKQQFVLSPNPANDVATLTFNLNKKTDLTLEILNESGQMMLRKSLKDTQSASLDFDTREWASGAYFIHLTDGKGVKIVKQLVVQH